MNLSSGSAAMQKRADAADIVVTQRPDTVSWEEISRLLKSAHTDNVRRGVRMPYPQLSPEELREKTEGAGGRLYVAFCEGRLAGVGAVVRLEKKFWYGSGSYAYCFLGAVLPEFSGRGIYQRLVAARQQWAEESGLDRMMFDTHEKNVRMRSICRRNGFLPVGYRIRDDHNSVVFVKWLHGCPYPEWFVRLKFIRLKWKRKRNAKAGS